MEEKKREEAARVILNFPSGSGNVKTFIHDLRQFIKFSIEASQEGREGIEEINKFIRETLRLKRENRFKAMAATRMATPEDIANQRPPQKAQSFLCLLLEARDREAVIGDLAERYEKKAKRSGKLSADLWYYKQVVLSVYPFLTYAISKLRRQGTAR